MGKVIINNRYHIRLPMGCQQSKVPNTDLSKAMEPQPVDARVTRSVALLRHCVNKDTENIRTSLTSNPGLLAYPYNRVPLIFSVACALLDDKDRNRFAANWQLVTSVFSATVPEEIAVELWVTYYSTNATAPRSKGSAAVHVGELNSALEKPGPHKHKKKCLIGVQTGGNIKDLFDFINNHMRMALVSASHVNSGGYHEYEGSDAHAIEKYLQRNAKFATDHTNNIEAYWRTGVAAQYQQQYVNPYTNEVLPLATTITV